MMYLHISATLPISDVQKAFSNTFPFLKIEFFKNQEMHYLLPGDTSIAEAHKMIREGSVAITGDVKVKDLERALNTLLPLHAQVFRRSGNIWLETTMTDNWTLAQQNEHGREISAPDKKKDKVRDDYDLSRNND